MKAIRTELSLTRDEFDSYTVGVDAEVTFCLKEFRVCVASAELYYATACSSCVSRPYVSHVVT